VGEVKSVSSGRTWLGFLFLWIVGFCSPEFASAQAAGDESPAQTAPPPPVELPEQAAPEKIEEGTLTMLRALSETLQDRRAELEVSRAELGHTTDLKRQEVLRGEIALREAEVQRLGDEIEALATGLDLEKFRADLHAPMNLREEAESLLRPLLEELKEATETPRQIEQLRQDLTKLKERKALAERALERIGVLAKENQDPSLAGVLAAADEHWKSERRQLANQITITDYQLNRLLENRRSLLESSSDLASTFFRTRGLNVLLALLAFIAVFVGFRVSYHLISRARRGRARTFASRLTRVLFFFTAFFAATMAVLLVLYAEGDWVLLGLTLIFLAGLAWAGRMAAPRYVEQVRMLLNLGSVRENERVVIDGVPYRVATLNLYTTLVNPLLTGGRIRRSLNSLMDLQSRPAKQDEVWFPCHEGDWVLLGDGTRGKVAYQGPEFVQLALKGGATVTYTTADFLGQSPKNQSQDFRINETFGIDYEHQAICTTEVPKKMHAALLERLTAQVGADNVRKVKVEFKTAGASSLDYSALCDFAGAVASEADVLQRSIQRILVDVCNEEGWVIPFTQVTVHQA